MESATQVGSCTVNESMCSDDLLKTVGLQPAGLPADVDAECSDLLTPQTSKTKTVAQPCKFYLNGNCSYGSKCKYRHVRGTGESGSLLGAGQRTVCWYYQNGYCRYGSRCGYLHARPSRRPHRDVLSKLGDVHIHDTLRDTEIAQFKKKFPKFTQCDKWFSFTFLPSDPDWPYDVRQLNILVFFPENYPKEQIELKLGENDRLPKTVCSQLEIQLQDMLLLEHQKFLAVDKADLFFRLFLKKLDKQLEEMFTNSLKVYQKEVLAKAAGLVFVPHFELPGARKSGESARPSTDHVAPATVEAARRQGGTGAFDPADLPGSVDNSDDDSDSSEEEEAAGSLPGLSAAASLSPKDDCRTTASQTALNGEFADGPRLSVPVARQPRGTEVRLRSLQLLGDAATLRCTRLALIVACARCRHQEALAVAAEGASVAACPRCHNEQAVSYSASLMHAFSAVAGHLSPSGCTPFDVVLAESSFEVGCLNCGKESKLQGLQPGQVNKYWCLHCHQKMEMATERANFVVLQPAEFSLGNKENIERVVRVTRKKVKDPAMVEGQPLPHDGACGHYKKSFRWFRFPCCGKLYPCDKCHSLQETDHEMQFANRMVCGFCAREQAFSADRPCVACNASLNRPKTSHWEGGKGCREKMNMDKRDNKKYANTNKTVSKKTTNSKPSSAKNSIPRHAT